jgi:hypothetical protein
MSDTTDNRDQPTARWRYQRLSETVFTSTTQEFAVFSYIRGI